MKHFTLLFIGSLLLFTCSAQETRIKPSEFEPLPLKMFLTLRDSVTSMDVVFLKGEEGSLSVEGKNVRPFNSFFENKSAAKTGKAPDGNIMWLINGREFISGNYFLGDSIGYVVFQKDGKEFVNQISQQGNSFLKSPGKN